MTRTLDELYALVTDAVTRAQQTEHPDDHAALSKLEEEIASITSGADIEGQIARVGAIVAAKRSLDDARALALYKRYRTEVPQDAWEELNQLADTFRARSRGHDDA